jgi:FAD-dependent urate hydroxylase
VSDKRALIVGAGIGGLAAGIALRRAGWDVRIRERAASPRELGFGLLLAPNALAALRELGLGDTVARAGATTAGIEIRRTNGKLIRRFNAQDGGPWVVALRSVLYAALLEEVGEGVLTLNSEAISFSSDADNVTLHMKDGSSDTGALLVGADGVNSAVRRTLHPAEPPPMPSGFCAVRGVAFGVGDQLGELSGVSYLDDGIEAAVVRASSDAVYWYLSLLSADVQAERRTAHAIVQQRLEHFEPMLQAVLSATNADDMRFDDLHTREPLDRWGMGRVTLLGDAAHPVLPHTGQGAAQALEDAVALGLAIRRTHNVEQALRLYERVRSRRTRKFVTLGPRIARVTTTHSSFIQALRTAGIRFAPARLLSASARKPGDPHRELRQLRGT